MWNEWLNMNWSYVYVCSAFHIHALVYLYVCTMLRHFAFVFVRRRHARREKSQVWLVTFVEKQGRQPRQFRYIHGLWHDGWGRGLDMHGEDRGMSAGSLCSYCVWLYSLLLFSMVILSKFCVQFVGVFSTNPFRNIYVHMYAVSFMLV